MPVRIRKRCALQPRSSFRRAAPLYIGIERLRLNSSNVGSNRDITD